MTQKIQSRRTVLASMASAGFAAFSGCLAGIRPGTNETGQSTPFEQITVEGVHLVVELSTEISIDRLSIIEPSGELFAERSISPGVTRETARLGTAYNPGEYEVRGLKEDETVGKSTIDIQPEIQIMDVKLARNHPDKIFEGAGESDIRSEVLVSVQNKGTGPDAITKLRFEGDVPQPTSDNLDESGIYGVDSELHRYADKVVVPAGQMRTLYSYSQPFSSAGTNFSCSPSTATGEITVIIQTQVSSDSLSRSSSLEYTGERLVDCEINIVEGDN